MALLIWTPKYNVGVKALDDQHIVLVEILNELHAAILKGQAHDIAGPLFKKLTDYVREHFTDEERLMEDTKYPGLAKQSAEHRALTAKVRQFIARYEQGDQAMYPQLQCFLVTWLHDHMLTVDKQYTQWMNEHGVH